MRTNAFAAVVMLLIEFGLGVGVNLYSDLPASDHGKGLLTAFGAAVTGGPIALTLHALLGTLLLITGIAAVVRATLARRTLLICVAILAFVAILVAWVAGAKFVGDMSAGPSLLMALATAVAILCYATVLFIAPTSRSARGDEISVVGADRTGGQIAAKRPRRPAAAQPCALGCPGSVARGSPRAARVVRHVSTMS